MDPFAFAGVRLASGALMLLAVLGYRGAWPKVNAARQRASEVEANALTVRLELMKWICSQRQYANRNHQPTLEKCAQLRLHNSCVFGVDRKNARTKYSYS